MSLAKWFHRGPADQSAPPASSTSSISSSSSSSSSSSCSPDPSSEPSAAIFTAVAPGTAGPLGHSQALGAWRLVWDPTKIVVSPDAAAHLATMDELFLRNVALGLIVTAKVWPVILPSEDAAHPEARHRTIGFLKRAVHDPAALLGPLDYDQRCGVAASARDLWLACDRQLFDDPAEKADMRALAEALALVLEDGFLPLPQVAGVHVSFFPRASCRVLRFAPDFPAVLEREVKRAGFLAAADEGAGGRVAPDEAAELGELFIQFPVDATGAADPFYYTWVDASDLSYHNFECILPLDRALRPVETAGSTSSRLSLSVENARRLHPQMDVFSCTLGGPDLPLLYRLDELGLYLEPSNAAQRGGRRLVFSSTALANGLTRAIRDSNFFEVMLGGDKRKTGSGRPSRKPYRWRRERSPDRDSESDSDSGSGSESVAEEETEPLSDAGDGVDEAPRATSQSWVTPSLFRFVNYVFRLNKFEPSDERFRLHRDTPYYDGSQNHLSKFTMLIYLTPGEASCGALRIFKSNPRKQSETSEPQTAEQDVCVVGNIASAQCIVFDQRYSHEGDPFDNGSKIFLRTELIFECPRKLQHIPRIGSLFSSAVYHTIESAFDDEFSKHAHELYERVNRSHWGLSAEMDSTSKEFEPTPILIKTWKGLTFATDGSSYWFPLPPDAPNDNKVGARPLSDQKNVELHIKSCATVVLLDFFNGKLSQSGAAFRKDCTTTVETPPKQALSVSQLDDWVLSRINNEMTDSRTPVTPACDRKKWLFGCERSESPKKQLANKTLGDGEQVDNGGDDEVDSYFSDDDDEDEDSDDGKPKRKMCCAYHYSERFKAWRCNDTIKVYLTRFQRAIDALSRAPVALLGTALSVDPRLAKVCGSAVLFNDAAGGGVSRVNFAACWMEGFFASPYVGAREVGCAAAVDGLPPMPFRLVTGGGEGGDGGGHSRAVRFQVDFFKNDWVDDGGVEWAAGEKPQWRKGRAARGGVRERVVKLPVFLDESDYIFE